MRIISGRYKGRVIYAPASIRPTQDKVRKALFDILGDIEGLSFLELFAGSGAVGFEAVSRGAAELTLVEANRGCLLAISKNIESLGLKACRVYPLDAEKVIKGFCKDRRNFDIIFLDPPYYKGSAPRLYPEAKAAATESLTKKILQTLSAYDILAPNGLVVTQHFKKDILPDRIGNLKIIKQAKYGDTSLSFYKKESYD